MVLCAESSDKPEMTQTFSPLQPAEFEGRIEFSLPAPSLHPCVAVTKEHCPLIFSVLDEGPKVES